MPLKMISELRPGDMVDLEGDRYADPRRDNPLFPYEYAVVEETERETPGCVCVYFDAFTCGFPPDHVVEVAP